MINNEKENTSKRIFPPKSHSIICLTEYASIINAGSFPKVLAAEKISKFVLLNAAARLTIPDGIKGKIGSIMINKKESIPFVVVSCMHFISMFLNVHFL